MIRLSQKDYNFRILDLKPEGDRYVVTFEIGGKTDEISVPKRFLKGRNKEEMERILDEYMEIYRPSMPTRPGDEGTVTVPTEGRTTTYDPADMRFRRIAVQVGESDLIDAWVAIGQDWNGWLIPFFEPDDAEQLRTALRHELFLWEYDAGLDAYVTKFREDDPDEVWDGKNIRTPIGVRKAYPIGAWAWKWDSPERELVE